MKRTVSILLIMSLLLCFTSCGEMEGSDVTSSHNAEPSPAGMVTYQENAQGYVIPTAWAQDSINDGTWDYDTAGVETGIAGTYYEMREGYVMTRLIEDEANVLIRLNPDGTEDLRITVPKPELAEGDSWAVGEYRFGTEWVWFVENQYTLLDEETGETSCRYLLKKWSFSGEELLSIPLDEGYGITPDGFLAGLELDPEGNPVLMTLSELLFCDEMGNVVARYETEDAPTLDFVRDARGRIYCVSLFEGMLYTMDWENHCLGEPLLELKGNEQVYTGGGGYDLLLTNEAKLRGVDFQSGTVTEILNWTDLDLGGMVGAVACPDEESFLVNVNDSLLGTSALLKLSRIPAGQTPEKEIVTMAVAMNPMGLEHGASWIDCIDQKVASQIANFNRTSKTHRVEGVTYSTPEELQTMVLSGDAPDIISWNRTLDVMPSMEQYAAKGYLTDLEPLMDQDPELSKEDFIPNILELAIARTGGLYVLPGQFHLTTLIGKTEYVGSGFGDSFGEMLVVAEQVPEDMCLFAYESQRGMLNIMLADTLDRFVDREEMTCDFCNQDFYDLLQLCRDHFPTEVGEDYIAPAGGSVLEFTSVLGRMGQFASDVLRDLETSGRCFVSFPGDEGNGFSVTFYEEYSICALGDQQEAAWAFLKTMYSYDFQYAAGTIFHPIREDAFREREDWYLEVNGSCTEEESLAARELVYGAKRLRSVSSPVIPIVLEEADAYFAGDKTAEQVAQILESRVKIYLSEQS